MAGLVGMVGLLGFITWNPNEGFGPFRWYGLCWLIGLALAYYIVKRLYKEQKIKDELFDPLFIYCFIGILLGARLGHCIFYEPDHFLTSGKGLVEMFLPIRFLAEGGWKYVGYQGLASHGGTLGLIIALWLYVRKTKISIWTVLDNIAIATGITACFIRLGNLMNSEIIGKVTDVPWAFIFERVDMQPRHPGQLYEAIAYGILFALMWLLHKRMPQKIGTGWYFGFCLTYIFTFRFFIEYTKEIQEAFEATMPLDMGQILSIPFIIIGVLCMAGGKWMKRLTMIAVLMTASTTLQAQDSDKEEQLVRRYYELASQDNEEEFLKVSKEAKELKLKENNRNAYYVLAVNEVNYEIQLNHDNKALNLAIQVLNEMKEHGDGRYDLIYYAMASIYENRGNYRMARHYNDKAIQNIIPNDTVGMIGAYISIANLEASVHPDETLSWVEKLLPLCHDYPTHYNYALMLKAFAAFFKNDSELFFHTLEAYNIHNREFNVNEVQNDNVIEALKMVFEGKYKEALERINNDEFYIKHIGRCDLRIQTYKIMGDKDNVIAELENRQNLIDSLNTNFIYENLNEMNAMLEVNKTEKKAEQVRIYWLVTAILLLLTVLGLLLWRHLTRRKLRKKLVEQNKKLEIALSRAEESDRMKTSFIEHVSHEIRTPLNVITGFAQIITNPDYELEQEDRNRMLHDISHNTTEITNIVNELLEIAQDESRQHYEKKDKVLVNELCEKIINKQDTDHIQKLKLDFITDLTNDISITTNKDALEKILKQLLDNAVKFTKEGRVELYVQESPDHGTLRFSITDTGIGIAKEHQDHIFDKFFKADSFKQGFGLGLTVCKKMAILLGGSLHLDREYTNGARFILTLPTA